MWEMKTEIGSYLEENIFYSILSTDEPKITMMFVDFKYDPHKDSNEFHPEVFGPDIFKKEIELKTVPVEIKNDDIYRTIKDHLNLEYVKIIKELAIEHRIVSVIGEKFDIDIDKWKEDMIITPPIDNNVDRAVMRRIIAKLNSCSSYIAVSGRIGPAHFIITNEKTNKFLCDIIGDKLIFSMFYKFVVDTELNDEDIILGRKNNSDQPGTTLILKEKFDDIIEKDNKKFVNLTYSFTVNGFKPETQYYLINKK